MTQPDFSELEDHLTFQRLCGDLLLAEGCCNMRGPGTGADQGADLLVDVPVEMPLGRDLIPYLVQCKWYATNRNVGADELGDVLGFLALHRAAGLLIVTSGDFSGTAITKANSIDKDPANPYRIKLWNGAELKRRLRRHPGLIAKHWFPIRKERPSTKDVDPWPLFDPKQLAARFGAPLRYSSVTIETLRATAADSERIRLFEEFAAVYGQRPPVLTIVKGAIGSGKTSVAWTLLNSRRAAGALVAGLAWHDVMDLVFSYVHQADERLPQLISALGAVDFLLFDDFGNWLGQRSETQLLACRTVVEVVEHRIRERRPTLLTVGQPERTPNMLQAYIEHLERSYPTIDCGSNSLRQFAGIFSGNDRDEREGDFATQRCWLSKNWLGGKMEEIEGELAAAATLLAFPEVAFAEEQRLFEELGVRETREERVLARIRNTLARVREYRERIEELPWKAIRFEDDRVELELDNSEI